MSPGRMIFYATVPNEHGIGSGAGVRRRAMLAAFRELGYEVEEVTGRIDARLPAMRRVTDGIAAGAGYDFLYMENATIPLHMTEPRLALVRRHPLADVRFLRYCRGRGIPLGIYNTDVHWRFPSYRKAVPVRRRLARLPFYYLEYSIYSWLADVFYVPHIGMAAWIPGRFRRVEMLPHAADPKATTAVANQAETPPAAATGRPGGAGLRLFYVGGLGLFYRLHNLLEAVRRVDGVRLTLCCRPDEWRRWRASYEAVVSDRVEIVHAHGEGLLPHFRAADVLSCFVAPDPYWRVTLPTKVFEYLGHGKPILAAAATNAGDFVRAHDLGWAVPDDAAAIADLLAGLRHRPGELAAKAANIRRILPEHTWAARARKVAADLRRGRPSP